MQQRHFSWPTRQLTVSEIWQSDSIPPWKPFIKAHLYWFTINAMPRFFNNHGINSSNNSRLVDGCITSKTWQAVATDCFTWTLVPKHCELDITFHDIKIPCNHWLRLLYRDQDLREKELKVGNGTQEPLAIAPHVKVCHVFASGFI